MMDWTGSSLLQRVKAQVKTSVTILPLFTFILSNLDSCSYQVSHPVFDISSAVSYWSPYLLIPSTLLYLNRDQVLHWYQSMVLTFTKSVLLFAYFVIWIVRSCMLPYDVLNHDDYMFVCWRSEEWAVSPRRWCAKKSTTPWWQPLESWHVTHCLVW